MPFTAPGMSRKCSRNKTFVQTHYVQSKVATSRSSPRSRMRESNVHMFDIHCHILPGVDDGARDWETAVAMCRMAEQDGIQHIVATPHANDEYFYDRKAHQELLDQLRERSKSKLSFSLGCDFHLSYENFCDFLANPTRYSINGGKYLLVEFNDFVIPPNTQQLFHQIAEAGCIPVITHPERNPVLQRNPKPVLQWVEHGAVVQVTANSLTGRWGVKALQAARFLFDHRAVHVLATDAHNTEGRAPVLSAARAKVTEWYGVELADALVRHNPESIVRSTDLAHYVTPRL